MSCCEATPASKLPPGSGMDCAACGSTGSRVELITLKALLNPRGLHRNTLLAPRFCPHAACPVVYFDALDGTTLGEEEMTVRVHAKHPADASIPVCYCFDVTAATMAQEIALTGTTHSRERVAQEVKAGRCACEVKNPKGSCCLGDLVRVERDLIARLSGNVVSGAIGKNHQISKDTLSPGSDE